MKETQIELRSIHETWKITYEKAAFARTTIKKIAPYHLLIKGDTKKHRIILESWLKKKARRHLGNWLRAISHDLNIPFINLSIRGQKTRWGSCSSQKNINLNYKLLFLPASLVDYVLVHELCHIKELNHSKKFWQLVENHDTNYHEHRKLLHQANQYLPKWVR